MFEAVDGAEISKECGFSDDIKYMFRDNDFGMRPGVVGCALSHIKLWQRLVKDDENDYYLIYEDDVEFSSNYTWRLFGAMQSITFSWDMLFLGHLVRYELCDNHRVETNTLPIWEKMSDYIVPERRSYIGTASYMISKSGALKLLNDIQKTGVTHGIDYYIQLRFDKLLRAYGLRPMLNTAEYPSSLNPNMIADTDIQ